MKTPAKRRAVSAPQKSRSRAVIPSGKSPAGAAHPARPARPAHPAKAATAAMAEGKKIPSGQATAAAGEGEGGGGYVPSENEKYMSKRQLQFFRRRIERMREEIERGVERTVANMQEEASAIPDDNDRASKESEFAVELRERDRDRRLLGKISRALAAIEDGSFGYCEECGDPVGVARLLARPVASLCIECKDLQERLEQNRTR